MVTNDPDSVRAVSELVDPALAARTIVAVEPRDAHRIRIGARAIFTIVGETGGFFGVLGRLLAPRPISILFEPGYRLFARNRGRLARLFPDPE